MTRWPGSWPGAWPGDWQGGQEASPFVNLSMRVTASATVTATLEAVGGAGGFADMATLGQGTGSLVGTLAGADAQEGPLYSIGFGYASPAKRKPQRRHEYADLAAVMAGGSHMKATAQTRQGFDLDSMLVTMAERTETERRRLRNKRDEEALLALL